MPEGLLVYDSSGIAHVPYAHLRLQSDTTSFIEDAAPRDTEVIGWTWRYVNKDGGPDRRFNNNVQLPICRYGTLHLAAHGVDVRLMTSRATAPVAFAGLPKVMHQAIAASAPTDDVRASAKSPAKLPRTRVMPSRSEQAQIDAVEREEAQRERDFNRH